MRHAQQGIIAIPVFALLCVGCAVGTVRPGGTTYAFAVGNAAWTSCPLPSPAPVANAAQRAGDVAPMPIPSPIQPKTQTGCTIVQGGAETGTALTILLGLVVGLLI